MKRNRMGFSCHGMCLAAVLFLSASLALSNDWTQWRGPKRDAVSTESGLLKDWPAAGPPLAWMATGLGEGYSSIATSGPRLFGTGDKGDRSYVVALNLADGKPLWSAHLGRSGAPGWGDFAGPRSTVTVDGDSLFAIGQWGELVCFETATGQEKWRKDLVKDFGGEQPEWGFSESPLVDGGKVVFTPGGAAGAIAALDKKTGALLWRSKEFTDAAHYASLIVTTFGGVRRYTQLTEASLAGVAAADGKLLWRAPRRGATAVIPTPISLEGFIYVTSGYAVGCHLFQVTETGGRFRGDQVYANKVMVNHHGGVVRQGDHIYGYSDGKGWTCQEWKTGQAVWQEREKLAKGSIVYADDRLYLRAEEGKGTVALIEASPAGYKEHGRFDPPKRSDKNSWSHPVIANGKLYLRDQDVLLCYEVRAK